MTVIEIRPHRWGWKAFESPNVERVFPKKDQAIDYAQQPVYFRLGEIRVLDSNGNVERVIPSTTRIESWDAVIRVYDEAGNVVETHEHKGRVRNRRPLL